jgi:hypothetical protein
MSFDDWDFDSAKAREIMHNHELLRSFEGQQKWATFYALMRMAQHGRDAQKQNTQHSSSRPM